MPGPVERTRTGRTMNAPTPASHFSERRREASECWTGLLHASPDPSGLVEGFVEAQRTWGP